MKKYCGNCYYLRKECPGDPEVCVKGGYSSWKHEAGETEIKEIGLTVKRVSPIIRKIRKTSL